MDNYNEEAKKLFQDLMKNINISPKSDIDNVIDRMGEYGRVGKSGSEWIQIAKAELPNMYNKFVLVDTEYNNMLHQIFRGIVTQAQNNKYYKLNSDRTSLQLYIRQYEKALRDAGKLKDLTEFEEKRKQMGIFNSDLWN